MNAADIPEEVVAAAQRADAESRRKGSIWTAASNEQVRRLIAGAVTAERERLAREIGDLAADLDGPHLSRVAKAHLDGLRVAAAFIRDGMQGVADWEPQP